MKKQTSTAQLKRALALIGKIIHLYVLTIIMCPVAYFREDVKIELGMRGLELILEVKQFLWETR